MRELRLKNCGTQRETRTPTRLLSLRPERSASTNSATWAQFYDLKASLFVEGVNLVAGQEDVNPLTGIFQPLEPAGKPVVCRGAAEGYILALTFDSGR